MKARGWEIPSATKGARALRLNAFAYRALRDAEYLSSIVGAATERARFPSAATQLAGDFNRYCGITQPAEHDN